MTDLQLLTTALRLAIGAIVAYGIATRNAVGALNALLALSVSLVTVPLGFPPETAALVAGIGVVHAVGALGWYRSVWWWDHVAHTLAGAVVAAVGYAAIVVAGRRAGAVTPPAFALGFAVAFALACGVLWELLEVAARDVATTHGLRPLLTPYGVSDVVGDLLFDGVGAALSPLLNRSTFVGVVRQLGVVRLGTLDAAFAGLLVLVVGLGLQLERFESDRARADRPARTHRPPDR